MSNNRQNIRPKKMNEFLSKYKVFTIEELDSYLAMNGSTNSNTRKAILTYYQNKDRIKRIRRGLYATVPLGNNPESSPVDPYLVAAKMTKDAVLAYHTALEFYGKAYSLHKQIIYVSQKKSLPLKLRSYEIKGVTIPNPLRVKGKEMFGVTSHKRSGVDVRVTNLERTFVDVLDRPDLAGSWEEIWRSLESIEFFDLDQVIEYTFLLENTTTAAKVGFYLEQHKENLMGEDSHLKRLRKLRPQQPHYLIRGKRKDCQWNKNWNLMVPADVQNKSWEDVS